MAARSLPWILISAIGIAGCRGTPHPATSKQVPATPQAPAEATPQTPETPTPIPAAPSPEKTRRSDSAVVVDPGAEGDGTPASLVEAARVEKERRARSGQSTVVINDKSLPRYASKGQITVADPKDKKKGAAAKTAPAPVPAAEARDETYWRNRAREIRERWRQTAEDVKKLEQKSTELRQKFYLENDLFVRDNQIKPDWDRVLDRLRQTRLDQEEAKQELDAFLEEGRAAGAAPLWLSEGEEEEPQQETSSKAAPKRKDPVPPARSIEPPTFDRDSDDGRPPGARP
jgi:hypothetical protein